MSPLSPSLLYQEDFSNNSIKVNINDKDWIDKYGNNEYGYKQYEDDHGHTHSNDERRERERRKRHERDEDSDSEKEWYETEQGMVYIGTGVAGLGIVLIVMASLRKS